MAKRQWVLGFDGNCTGCRRVADEVESLSNGRLTARSLRDPEVTSWRTTALGQDAP
mgnify:CR=1 FL=1